MRLEELVVGIAKKAGVAGIKKAEDALTKLSKESKEPWKRAIMELLGEAVGKYGVEGIKRVEDAVGKIAKGEQPDMSFASLKARSDFLAVMENMEADDKSKAKDFFSTIGSTLGTILKAVIAGLLS